MQINSYTHFGYFKKINICIGIIKQLLRFFETFSPLEALKWIVLSQIMLRQLAQSLLKSVWQFLRRWQSISLKTQLYYSKSPTQSMRHPTSGTLAQPRSSLLYSWQPETGDNLGVLQQKSGQRKCGNSHNGVLHSHLKNGIIKLAGKWTELGRSHRCSLKAQFQTCHSINVNWGRTANMTASGKEGGSMDWRAGCFISMTKFNSIHLVQPFPVWVFTP